MPKALLKMAQQTVFQNIEPKARHKRTQSGAYILLHTLAKAAFSH